MPSPKTQETQTEWLERFHGGDRAVLTEVYREHFQTVERALMGKLGPADRENVIHEVFCALLSERAMRERFQGGKLAAWLRTVAKNRAIDLLRKRRRETTYVAESQGNEGAEQPAPGADLETRVELRTLLRELKDEVIPKKWWSVFEARFVDQMSQREAAERLGVSRTTLAYRELRVRGALKRHLLSRGGKR